MPFFPSKLGFGVSGSLGTALVSFNKTLALIEQAYQGGVRVFDTAPAYGAGEAERRLGQALHDLRPSNAFVMTKAGVTSTGLANRKRNFCPKAIEESVRESLSRLGVAGVNALTLHGPDPSELSPELFERLDGLKNAGAFEHLGIAGRGLELEAGLATGRFDYAMAPVHPFLADDEHARLERIEKANLPIVAIETSGDSPKPLSVPNRPSALYGLVKSVRSRLQGREGRGRIGTTDGLKAAQSRPGVHCTLVSTSRSHHLDDNLEAVKTA